MKSLISSGMYFQKSSSLVWVRPMTSSKWFSFRVCSLSSAWIYNYVPVSSSNTFALLLGLSLTKSKGKYSLSVVTAVEEFWVWSSIMDFGDYSYGFKFCSWFLSTNFLIATYCLMFSRNNSYLCYILSSISLTFFLCSSYYLWLTQRISYQCFFLIAHFNSACLFRYEFIALVVEDLVLIFLDYIHSIQHIQRVINSPLYVLEIHFLQSTVSIINLFTSQNCL